MEDELLRIEEAFAEAIVRNDLERIGRLVADDWVVIDPNGIDSEESYLSAVRTGLPRISRQRSVYRRRSTDLTWSPRIL